MSADSEHGARWDRPTRQAKSLPRLCLQLPPHDHPIVGRAVVDVEAGRSEQWLDTGLEIGPARPSLRAGQWESLDGVATRASGEVDGCLEKRTGDSCLSVVGVDEETRNQPDAIVVAPSGPQRGSSDRPGEPGPRPDRAPPHRFDIAIGEQPDGVGIAGDQIDESLPVALTSGSVKLLHGDEEPHAPAAIGHTIASEQHPEIIEMTLRDLLDPKRIG